ncbi:MAG: CRISPR-associated helicase Cas3', partial [Enterovibrio sp.]
VADWIGSGHWFSDPKESWLDKVQSAIEAAGFVPFHVNKNLTFGDIFTDHNNQPYQANECQLSLAKHCTAPGVYVLEAPMGLGRTEAALFAAYQLLAKGEASGIYFALPTQLTSNKIWERFDQFLQAILDKESPHRYSLLLHANARLVEQELGKEGMAGHSWFDQNKRGLLAPFAVGTLDQALMAAMNVKHGFVRAYGLAGKVVILDEVHSYDAYTSLILDSLIKLLRQLHCTVIILSATLSQSRRRELLQVEVKKTGYPLLTVCQHDQSASSPFDEIPLSLVTSQQININLINGDDKSAIEEALERAQAGQQVLWIENTVNEAQSCYLDLAARAAEVGVECGLLHSRFSPAHRQQHENYWVAAFGKAGWPARSNKGRILIGTQVLEQSLDIDADFLLTRMAPTDMLLQRLGRLWRHIATPRAAGAQCEAWILTPTLDEALKAPQQAFGATAFVYAPYILCRSLEVWQGAGNSFTMTLPVEIRRYIDATYIDREGESPQFAALRHEFHQGSAARKGIDVLRQQARLMLAVDPAAGKTLPESKAQTRYSEQENTSIVILRKLQLNREDETTTLFLLDGSEMNIPWQKSRLSDKKWREMAIVLSKQLVPCPERKAPVPPNRNWCQKVGLGNVIYLGYKQQELADQAWVCLNDCHELVPLDGSQVSLHQRFSFRYRQDLGLEINLL